MTINVFGEELEAFPVDNCLPAAFGSAEAPEQ